MGDGGFIDRHAGSKSTKEPVIKIHNRAGIDRPEFLDSVIVIKYVANLRWSHPAFGVKWYKAVLVNLFVDVPANIFGKDVELVFEVGVLGIFVQWHVLIEWLELLVVLGFRDP